MSGAFAPPEFILKDPRIAYRLDDSPLREFINKKASDIEDVLGRIREDLGFDSKTFNNEKPEDVLRILDGKMNERLGYGLLTYLSASEALGGRSLFYTLLSIIDSANFWGDIKTKHSAIARLNDAYHGTSLRLVISLSLMIDECVLRLRRFIFFENNYESYVNKRFLQV